MLVAPCEGVTSHIPLNQQRNSIDESDLDNCPFKTRYVMQKNKSEITNVTNFKHYNNCKMLTNIICQCSIRHQSKKYWNDHETYLTLNSKKKWDIIAINLTQFKIHAQYLCGCVRIKTFYN